MSRAVAALVLALVLAAPARADEDSPEKPVPDPSYKDTTVVSGATYYYVVTAVDAAGLESGDSNEASTEVPTP